MGKAYAKCKLCGTERFLNYAGLCKKCNSSKASTQLVEEAIEQEEEMLEAQQEEKKQEQEDLTELHALEEKEDLTSEEK